MRVRCCCYVVFRNYLGDISNFEYWMLGLRCLSGVVSCFVCACAICVFLIHLRLLSVRPTLKAMLCREERDSCDVALFVFVFCGCVCSLVFSLGALGLSRAIWGLLCWCNLAVCILDSYRLHKPLARKPWLTVYRAHQRFF